METGHFLMLFVPVLISSTGSSSEDHVFVQTGGSLQMDIKNKTIHKLHWTYKEHNIVRFIQPTMIKIHSSYEGRVDFNDQTFSLTLKNMQKTDNGVYTAKEIGAQERNVAMFNVSVIDAVDSPVVEQNFTMISLNSCIVDVNCSTQKLSLSSRYHSSNCSQQKVTSFGIQTLTLYCKQNVVVCNYSNPVSRKTETIEINQLCPPNKTVISVEDSNEENRSFPLHWVLMIIAGVPLLVLAVLSVICCAYKKRKKDDQQTDNTIYTQVEAKNKAQRPLEMLETSTNPQTVYGFTGEHKPTGTSQRMPNPETRAQERTDNLPGTTYSTVGQHKPPMKPFLIESEQTIYSKVCKPVE